MMKIHYELAIHGNEKSLIQELVQQTFPQL